MYIAALHALNPSDSLPLNTIQSQYLASFILGGLRTSVMSVAIAHILQSRCYGSEVKTMDIMIMKNGMRTVSIKEL